jgi:hypothetical protein
VCLVRRTVGSEEISEPVTVIKCEFDDQSLGLNNGLGGVSATMALGIKSMTNNIVGNNTEGSDCVVCGDRATGMF